jgi:signal peptide peptidase SppA
MNSYIQKTLIVLLLATIPHAAAHPINLSYSRFFQLLAGAGIVKLGYDIGKYFCKRTPTSQKTIISTCFNGKITYAQVKNIVEWLNDNKDNPTIAGLILEIDSGGGSAGNSWYFYNELRYFAEKKPVVVMITGCCCSGAYLVSSAAKRIVASAMANIGSIGVYSEVSKFEGNIISKEDSLEGIKKYYHFFAGKYKLTTNEKHPGPLDEEEKNNLQTSVDHIYKIFYTTIAQQRPVSIAEKHIWAEGKEFNAQEALELKLVDTIGSFTDAKNELIALINKTNPTLPYNTPIQFL